MSTIIVRAAGYHPRMGQKQISAIIGILFGVALIVIAVTKPAFAWDFELVRQLRGSVGEVLAMVFCIVGGVAIIGSSLLALLKTKSAARG
jgi:hypothetical protein